MDDMQKTEHKILESSCSISHFFREMAQIYEVLTYKKIEKLQATLNHPNYPNIAARLLLSGFSLELMDGDAGSIPIIWIEAVFKSVSDLLKDAKILVLSILGVQSSGKSTLLNAMFGVQFDVSAGRCTRGVNMQLVKMGEKSEGSNLHFDYILILDSEGIRALEGSEGGIKRDNEIATLVIGLSDLTIMNIKGEQYTDVQDVLQITVHAFLRMHLHGINTRCVFVHQNVPAPDAAERLLLSRDRLVASLNEATRSIATLENKSSITDFRQIVQLDPDSHLFYFGDIKLGDQPMAPTNPNYYDKVVALKYEIFKCFERRSDIKTADKILTDLKCLWEGIIWQKFVFQFRNSDDIEQYTYIENRIRNYYIELNKFVNTECYNEAVETFRRCSKNDELNKHSNTLKEKFIEDIRKMASQQEHSLFCIRGKQYIIPRHRMCVKGETPMHPERSTIIKRMETKVDILKENRQHEMATNKLNRHRVVEFKKLTESMITTNTDLTKEAAVKNSFELVWSAWVRDTQRMQSSAVDIVEEVKYLVIKYFPLHGDDVQRCIDESDISKPLLRLRELRDLIDINVNQQQRYIHMAPDRTLKDLIVDKNVSPPTEEFGFLLNKLRAIIKAIRKDSRFVEARVNELMKECRTFVEIHNRFGVGYEFTREFEYTVDVYIMKLVIPIFRERESAFEKQNNYMPEGNQHRQRMLTLFTSLIKPLTVDDEQIYQDFCHQLRLIISDKLRRTTWIDILSEVSFRFPNKSECLNLVHLRYMDNGYTLPEYIEILQGEMKDACLSAIHFWIINQYFSGDSRRGDIWEAVKGRLSMHIADFDKCIQIDPEAPDQNVNNYIQRIKIKLEQMGIQFDHQFHSKNMDDISRKLQACLKSVHDSLVDEINRLTFDQLGADEQELEQHLNDIWGCRKCCPICNEPCVLYSGHFIRDSAKRHCCPFHRPTAVIHSSKVKDLQLMNDNFTDEQVRWCTKDIEQKFATWTFDQNNGLDNYWSWFLSRNVDDLKDFIGDNQFFRLQREYSCVTISHAKALEALNNRSSTTC